MTGRTGLGELCGVVKVSRLPRVPLSFFFVHLISLNPFRLRCNLSHTFLLLNSLILCTKMKSMRGVVNYNWL